MCGIVGYVGSADAVDVVISALRRLEYRGYDSAGLAVVGDGALAVRRRAGRLGELVAALDVDRPVGTTAIGHTRWATHGGPTDANAHPHLACDGSVAVVHNGIIENYRQLADELTGAGHILTSDTDTEVAAHLLEAELTSGLDLTAAMRAIIGRLEGAFTLVAVAAAEPGVVVAARRNSPLVVGVGDGEMFVASDVTAFIAHTRHAAEIGQDQVVTVTATSLAVTDRDGDPVDVREYTVDWDAAAAEKGGHRYFMTKEIAEQPTALADTLRGRLAPDGTVQLDQVRIAAERLRDVDKVFLIGCGSAFHAGLIAKYAIEHWTRLACEVEIASEFRYRDPVLDRSTLVVAISQSGETLDTLMAVQHARTQKASVLAISNTWGSTIPRESDAVLYTRGGPEVAVAGTKSFLTQIEASLLVALALAQVRGVMYGDEIAQIAAELALMPQRVQQTLDRLDPVRDLARELADVPTVLFLGRHVGYPVALEGALKLKELAYIHAEGFPAAELKHGPIALVDRGVPVVCVMPSRRGRPELHRKMLSNLQEVRARGARTIVIAEDDDDLVAAHSDLVVPVPPSPVLLSPLVTTVPLQVFAAELAAARGLDVDQPRNLAKSVTVE